MTLLDHANTALDALARVPRDASSLQEMTEAELLTFTGVASSLQRLATTLVALAAGDVARRSDPGLGHDGLAQRHGHRTPQELVRVTSGSTARDAGQAVRVGALLLTAEPWLAPVVAGVIDGGLSVAAADAITVGLGAPSPGVDAAILGSAAASLVDLPLDADRLQRRARELRDELDESGVADREAARRSQRSLRFTRLPDGMSLLVWRLDPESAAVCGEIFDRATSPRNGGPRFVDEAATRIIQDPRTTEQLASDVFLELLRQGATTDSSMLLGSGGPIVRVVVTADALARRVGHGTLEGQQDRVSIETVERLACGGATVRVTVDADGTPLDVGREQRLFTRRQREALAVRDGGCRWPECDRPPSWTEAHHIQHWQRDGGATDVGNGILLCRNHHLLLHNNHWEIERDGPRYWLVPPPGLSPSPGRRLMTGRDRADPR